MLCSGNIGTWVGELGVAPRLAYPFIILPSGCTSDEGVIMLMRIYSLFMESIASNILCGFVLSILSLAHHLPFYVKPSTKSLPADPGKPKVGLACKKDKAFGLLGGGRLQGLAGSFSCLQGLVMAMVSA